MPLHARRKFIRLPLKTGDEAQRHTIPRIEGEAVKNEIQIFVINDCAIVSVGSMEAYVEIGLKIKEGSPFKHTFTVAYSNGPWLGYLPSEHGYAVNDPDAQETPFAPAAVQVLIGECVKLLHKSSSSLKLPPIRYCQINNEKPR